MAASGLQFERTDLSWKRLVLAFIANGSLLVIKHLMSGGSSINLLAGGAAFLLAVFAGFIAYRRRAQLARGSTVFNSQVDVMCTYGMSAGVVLLALLVFLIFLVE